MFQFHTAGSYCQFPRQTYCPADLTGEEQAALCERLERDARLDGLREEEAEEAAHAMFFHWLTRNYGRCNVARGDHPRAYYAVRKYARLSRWKGFTGQRRGRKAQVTAESIALRERLRQRNLPLPHDALDGRERIQASPALRRKAERLAKRLGVSVDAMIREACGFAAE
jgi:hypothetical protein